METEQEQAQEKIRIIISNVIAEAHELKEMMGVAGKQKFQTKMGKISLSQLINPKKLDAKGFIGLISLMGHKEKVFGNLPSDVIKVVCLEMYGDVLNEELKNIFQ